MSPRKDLAIVSAEVLGHGVFVTLPGGVFEYHGGWLTARIEDNGSSSGSHSGFTVTLHTPHAGAGEPEEVVQRFTVMGNGEQAEFFRLMQRLGRAMGCLKDEAEEPF